MLSDNIEIGDRLEIKLKGKDSGDKVYISQVESVFNKNEIRVYVPISYGQLVKLPEESVFIFLFFTEKGMISFEGKVKEYSKEEGFNLMNVELLSKGERVQRRGFFRFSCVLKFNFYILDEDGNGDSKSDSIYEGVIKDISGGGLRFVTNEDIEESKTIKCLLDFDKEVLISIGNIIQKHSFPKSTHKYQYRVKFIGILPEEQEKIVQFIFDEQRRVLQRVDIK